MLPLVLLALIVGYLLYYYATMNYSYWKNKNVVQATPIPFFGNVFRSLTFQKTSVEVIYDIYMKFKNQPCVGIYEFRTPVLLLRDPELIKMITIKDFAHFQNRGMVFNEGVDPLAANLVNLCGQRWRSLRTKLTPVFTVVKLRNVFHLIANTAYKFQKYAEKFADNGDTVEMRDLAAKFTTEVVSTSLFGLETNSIQDGDSEFRMMCKRVIEPKLILAVKKSIRMYFPMVYKFLLVSGNPPDLTDYFKQVVNTIIEYREKTNETRNDLMQLMIELKNSDKVLSKAKNEVARTDDQNKMQNATQRETEIVVNNTVIAAQAYIFLLAGLDTSATTMSFAIYEIALNPDVQDKVYHEIRRVLQKHGTLTYGAISDMEYLDCVVHETLRMYPTVGVVPRTCNETYTVPGTGLIIEKDTKVLIPIYAIQRDPLYYEDPDEFKPERFQEEETRARDNSVFLPFGIGPRICIGMRFAYMQTKAGLAALLSEYEVSLSPRTQVPLQYDPTGNILTTKSGIWVKLRRRAPYVDSPRRTTGAPSQGDEERPTDKLSSRT